MKTLRNLLATILLSVAALLPISVAAQPAPSDVIGGYWSGSDCNVITFNTGAGPKTAMVDSHGNLCMKLAASSVVIAGEPLFINGPASVTHSAVTTAYAAGQLFALNTTGNAVPIQLPVTVTAGGSGLIINLNMQDSGTGATAPPGYTVYLFKALPLTTGLVDRSAYVNPYAIDYTNGSFLGSFTCASFSKTNDGTAQWASQCSSNNFVVGPMPYQAAAGQTYVYALVAVNAAYTPIASEVLTLTDSTTRDQ